MVFYFVSLHAQTLSFTEVSYSVGLHWFDYPYNSACWGDYDGDGDIDLYVPSIGYSITGPQNLNALLRNDMSTWWGFSDVANELGVAEDYANSWGAVFCDVNNDGMLDLYVCNNTSTSPSEKNKLFINTGNGFEDLTAAYQVNISGSNRNACWGDYDNDGDQDLFLCTAQNAAGMSRLFRNDGIYFTDVTLVYNISGSINIKSACWVDFDNDGDQDLYISQVVTGNKLYENRINEGFGVKSFFVCKSQKCYAPILYDIRSSC